MFFGISFMRDSLGLGKSFLSLQETTNLMFHTFVCSPDDGKAFICISRIMYEMR